MKNHQAKYWLFSQMAIAMTILSLPAAHGQQKKAVHTSVAVVAVPQDPAFKKGKLANGLTYYIRHNESPKKQVQLYLVNKVGSILETPEQLGLAHFMEHMNFNGTLHFPKNMLVDFLQKAGVGFGADLNAYTSLDETVYQLPLPDNNPEMLNAGLDILCDWSHFATLDSMEIEHERGVIIEEGRLAKGAGNRMSKLFMPQVLNHSRYADRLPIGKEEVIKNFRHIQLRQFYRDWYRPDLQAVIIVGDIDVKEVEKMIADRFAKIENPKPLVARKKYRIELTGKNQFITVTDPEVTTTTFEVLVKHENPVIVSQKDYQQHLIDQLFNQLVSIRVATESSLETNPAYLGMNGGVKNLMGNLNIFSFKVASKNGMLTSAIEQAWTVLEKIRQYGFTATELEDAKKGYLASLQQSMKEADKTPSVTFVKEYQDAFLHGTPLPSAAWEFDFIKTNLPKISQADIMNAVKKYIKDTDADMILTAPTSELTKLPDSTTLVTQINKIRSKKTEPFVQLSLKKTLGLKMPKAGKVVSTKEIPELGVTELVLSNGILVLLKPTDFSDDEILFRGFNPGGTSLYGQKDYDNATLAGDLINSAGVGTLNPMELSRLLNGKSFNVSTGIMPNFEFANGSSSAKDLETALQLLYLKMTSPRKDSTIFNKMIGNWKEKLRNKYADPGAVLRDTVSMVLGNHDFRAMPMDLQRLSQLNLDKALEIYKTRFSNANGFNFVFAGNFKIPEILPLLELYLGSLPSTDKKDSPTDLKIFVPRGQISKKVYKGSENKATVSIVFSGISLYSHMDNLKLKALGEILEIKLLQRLREEEGAVYSPSVSTSFSNSPGNQFVTTVGFGCDPKNTERLVGLVQEEMEKLKKEGPETTDIGKFSAAYLKNVETGLKVNDFWVGYLASKLESGENPNIVLDYKTELSELDKESLRKAAGKFFDGQNRIVFELLPENFK